MRKPIIAGNWKMYKVRSEAINFILKVADQLASIDEVDSVICAQSTVLRCLVKRQGKNLRIGAQNMHFEDQGAFTGEVSAPMLKEIEVEYVIIGHSERRAMFNETDEAINKKLHQAFKYGLNPILCVGESLDQRENNQTESHLRSQLEVDLKGLTEEQVAELVIAYEPIWAIGTGKTATSEIANDACKFVRSEVSRLFNDEVASKVRIQYGGSVKLDNIKELINMSDIDGALIGGASLVAEDFVELVKSAVK